MHLYGCWNFNKRKQLMTNTLTGQTVQDGGVNRKGHRRVTYRDNGLKFDLYASHTSRRPDIRYTNWMFDYTVSHKRNQGPWNSKNMDYGVWRRIDECVADALLVWPDENGIPHRSNGFELKGGWLNGSWTEGWVRRFRRNHQSSLNEFSNEPQRFSLIPLDLSPPPRWSYYTCTTVTPLSLEMMKPERGVPIYKHPSETDLSRLGKSVPHVLRDDGQAIILPVCMDGRWGYGESYRTYLTALYIDRDFTCRLTFEGSHADSSECRIKLPTYEASFRKGEIPDVLRANSEVKSYDFKDSKGDVTHNEYTSFDMSIAMWRRLNAALIDGLSVWPSGDHQTMPADQRSRENMHRILNLEKIPSDKEAGFDMSGLKNVTIDATCMGARIQSFNATCAVRWQTEIPYSPMRAGLFKMIESWGIKT